MILDSPGAAGEKGKYILCSLVVLSGLHLDCFAACFWSLVDDSSNRTANNYCSLELTVMDALGFT